MPYRAFHGMVLLSGDCHNSGFCLQESRRLIEEMESKVKQLSKDLKAANDEKAVSKSSLIL